MKVTRSHLQSMNMAINLAAKALADTTDTKMAYQVSQHLKRLRQIKKALFRELGQPSFEFHPTREDERRGYPDPHVDQFG